MKIDILFSSNKVLFSFQIISCIFSVIGLNFDYVYLNIVGHSVYGAFNVGLFWVKTIQVRMRPLYGVSVFLV
jgi:hypothetical protein